MPETAWRRFGWQQMTFIAPGDWFLAKVSIDRAEGELYLADQALPRVQLKWLDASRQKSVDPKGTLDRWIQQLERQAKKRKIEFAAERDTKLVRRGKRDVSSLECFRWQADIESYGLIWYSPEAQRVTLAQVNGPIGEAGLKTVARQVLESLRDTPEGDWDLWTAYDLECRVPADWRLKGLTTETGHTELSFERGKETLHIGRWGLASIVLERAGDLGDWAYGQRYKAWSTYALRREPGDVCGQPAIAFAGPRRSVFERFRAAVYNFFRAPYTVALAARAWHCAEANCLFVVEQAHDRRSQPIIHEVAARIPARPEPVSPGKA